MIANLPLQNVIDVLSKRAEETVPGMLEGDYFDDEGMLMCGKCHSRKQSLFAGFTQVRVVPCICKCEAERLRAERDREELRERVERLKSQGIHDASIGACTFGNDDGTNPKMKAARRYVDKFDDMLMDNIGLLIFGDVGTGKTYMAAAIANELLERGVPVLVTSFPRLLNKLSQFKDDNNAFLASLKRYKLLVIDDLGVERQSEYAMEQVYSIIDERYKSKLPLIITTNISKSEFDEPRDIKLKRIYDRIGEITVPIKVDGESRRKALNADKMRRVRELFADV